MPLVHELSANLPLPWSILPGPLVVIDIETTGTKAGVDRVIEVAAARVEPRGESMRVLSTVLDPGESVRLTQIHGITNVHAAMAPTFRQIAPHLGQLLDGATLVAHSASFEHRFLQAEFEQLGGQWGVPRLCTLMLARRLNPGRKGRGKMTQPALLELYGLEGESHHMALGDVISLSVLLAGMLNAHRDEPKLEEFVQQSIKVPDEKTTWPDLPIEAVEGLNRGVRDQLSHALHEKSMDGNLLPPEEVRELMLNDDNPAVQGSEGSSTLLLFVLGSTGLAIAAGVALLLRGLSSG